AAPARRVRLPRRGVEILPTLSAVVEGLAARSGEDALKGSVDRAPRLPDGVGDLVVGLPGVDVQTQGVEVAAQPRGDGRRVAVVVLDEPVPFVLGEAGDVQRPRVERGVEV